MTTRIRSTWTWSGRLCLGLGLGLMILGCNKNKSGTSGNESVPEQPPGTPAPGSGPPADEVFAKLPGGDEFAAARKVYANNTCANCHKLGESGPMKGGGPGGKMGGRGPDLTTVGAKAERTREWLAEHIRDPRTHRAKSGMPSFGPDKISDADLALLADYLASRK